MKTSTWDFPSSSQQDEDVVVLNIPTSPRNNNNNINTHYDDNDSDNDTQTSCTRVNSVSSTLDSNDENQESIANQSKSRKGEEEEGEEEKEEKIRNNILEMIFPKHGIDTPIPLLFDDTTTTRQENDPSTSVLENGTSKSPLIGEETKHVVSTLDGLDILNDDKIKGSNASSSLSGINTFKIVEEMINHYLDTTIEKDRIETSTLKTFFYDHQQRRVLPLHNNNDDDDDHVVGTNDSDQQQQQQRQDTKINFSDDDKDTPIYDPSPPPHHQRQQQQNTTMLKNPRGILKRQSSVKFDDMSTQVHYYDNAGYDRTPFEPHAPIFDHDEREEEEAYRRKSELHEQRQMMKHLMHDMGFNISKLEPTDIWYWGGLLDQRDIFDQSAQQTLSSINIQLKLFMALHREDPQNTRMDHVEQRPYLIRRIEMKQPLENGIVSPSIDVLPSRHGFIKFYPQRIHTVESLGLTHSVDGRIHFPQYDDSSPPLLFDN